jgi:hypothetical protein
MPRRGAERYRIEIAVGDRPIDATLTNLSVDGARLVVREAVADLLAEAEIVSGDPLHASPVGGDMDRGAFMAPVLLRWCFKPCLWKTRPIPAWSFWCDPGPRWHRGMRA